MFLSLKKLKINNLQLEAEISMRRQAEEALRKSEARLRQVIDLVPHYIYARDRHGRFILANQATANGFGTTVEDLIGKTDTDFNRNKKEVEQFLRDDLEVLRGGLPKEISEEKVTDSKGNICILHTIKIPYTVSSSGGEAVLAVSTDITRRKRAEEKSKESECRFREFADLLPQAVAEFDLMGNFTYGNLYGFAMFGYTQQEFDARTRNFSEMFVPQDLERLGSCIQKIFEGGKGSVNNEYTAKRKDGSVFPVMLYASPVLRGGKPAGWRAIACDITDEKRSNRP
jgi:PAS domain S-box-containing protein